MSVSEQFCVFVIDVLFFGDSNYDDSQRQKQEDCKEQRQLLTPELCSKMASINFGLFNCSLKLLEEFRKTATP